MDEKILKNVEPSLKTPLTFEHQLLFNIVTFGTFNWIIGYYDYFSKIKFNTGIFIDKC